MIRMASWNVNGIRAALGKGLGSWMENSGMDIICLQETKARREQVSPLELPSGYESVWQSARKPGYSGVAVFYKQEPLEVSFLGEDAFDSEGRLLVLRYPGFTLLNGYFPNSQDGGKRLDYKLDFLAALKDKSRELVSQGQKVVICGDYNIAHRPIDLARPKENEESPGYLPEEREWMEAFLQDGWVDTFRHLHPEPHRYSWWSYRAGARARNVGWRIDYFCVDKSLEQAVRAADIQDQVLGSDHCPVTLELDLAQ